jgi:hypothetical protein
MKARITRIFCSHHVIIHRGPRQTTCERCGLEMTPGRRH